MIKINVPFCTQSDFEKAYSVVKNCEVRKPVCGFTRPFFAPGGGYGECWWSLDAALAVDGYKWIVPQCELDFLENIASTQLEDGRVKLYGFDKFSASHSPYITVPIGSLPKFFSTCYETALRYGNDRITEKVLSVLDKNLTWWLNQRRDHETGLIWALFEETFVPNTEFPVMEYCPPDTNIQIVLGCKYAASLARLLRKDDLDAYYSRVADELLYAIQTYLWSSEKKCYCTYLLSKKQHYPHMLANSFSGMMYDTDAQRISAMCDLLTDDTVFGWENHTVTTVAKTDPLFQMVEGRYNGNPSWLGSVWTLTNKSVIDSLLSVGQHKLASDLALKTVQEFRNNYTEFHHPVTGMGHGVVDYAWTASQFIQIIIEVILGIRYNAYERAITIFPHLSDEIASSSLALEHMELPDGSVLSLYIDAGKIRCDYSGTFSVIY